MIVKDFVTYYLWATVSKQDVDRVMHDAWVIGAINIWLTWIYHYGKNGTYWLKSRSIRTERVENINCNPLIFNTTFPIARPIGMFLWPRPIIEQIDPCALPCNECWEEENCCCTCYCENMSEELTDLKSQLIAPWSPLTENTYKIIGWEFSGGLFWTKVHLKLCKDKYDMCGCNWWITTIQSKWLYFQYFSSYNQVKALKDTIPLPPVYLAPLALYVAGLTIARVQNNRVGDDVYYFTLAQNQLDSLAAWETNVGSYVKTTK